ncbi:MAG: TetR/AcrR family transcriptional regulator [Sedimentibacter saalensis]|jgi:AcrR family transcriptional regulator|uniref:TetR family transcriptional regulator n=1 Tax=Sedimentibacter saalensis TaxID=130788 RepID=A0A562J686_9FIRM|nr:TetR/AcrR family transcriptional regulator [Sedimentibacter saalensis]MEA5096345.1 TetR/AcrR family transcriptional regulator [Sedimentibacter saalensis]TWH78676.1 TetR family transcriptional regulator [Sedimentibacter saalensis]
MSTNKEIQRKRMLLYFIEATNKIIDNDGIENVTIRNVADIAGYNSATLYNYFEDLDHLIFFTSMKYLKEYILELPKFIKNSNNSLEVFMKTWECFCKFSFENPKIFYNIFFGKYKDILKETINEYYNIFPEELGESNGEILKMLKFQSIYDRNKIILYPLIEDGIIKEEYFDIINQTIIYSFQGILHEKVVGNEKSIEQSIRETMKIIEYIIMKRN